MSDGVHPLKQLRTQTIEQFEEEFTGKPAATVVRMQKPTTTVKDEETKRDVLFVPIIERTAEA